MITRGMITSIVIALCTSVIGPSHVVDASEAAVIQKRVAVLLVNFTHQPSEPWTKQFASDVYFGPGDSVASYFAEVSNGRMAITGSVFGYLTIAADTSRCASKAWGAAAREAARAAAINLGGYSTVVYVFPYQRTCWWAGLARGSAQSGRGDNWLNGLLYRYVASHELGHVLGLNHAGSTKCTRNSERVAFSATCSTYAYGDPFDVMGYSGQQHFHAWHRWRLGMLTPDEVVTVVQSGRIWIAPAAAPSDEPRLVRIRIAPGEYYALEFRQPYGAFDDFPADAAPVNGISIRIVRDGGGKPTKLLDATPQTCTFFDAPLAVGQTFVDSINDIAITTLSVGPEGAEVRIDTDYHGAPAEPVLTASGMSDAEPPGPPGAVAAVLTTGRTVAVNWSAAPDDNGVDHYVVTKNGNVVGRTCDLVLEDIVVADNRGYEFKVWAVDLAGKTGPSASVRITTPDLTSPSSPRKVRATATSASTVRLTWKAAASNSGVQVYRLRRNGIVIADLGSAARSYTDGALPPGTHRYTLTAMDTSGNASVPIKESVTLP